MKRMKQTAVLLAFFAAVLQLPAAAAAEALVPVGETVGIHMKIDGVMVVGLAEEEGGSPAAEAGLLPGDVIVKLGSRETRSAEDFLEAVQELGHAPVSVTVERGGKTHQFTLHPALDENGAAAIGVWLREGVAGTGTLTFYDPVTGCYGALGHGVTDLDTGVLLPLGSGEILDSAVQEVKKGSPGTPGELCGNTDGMPIGEIQKNTEAGIFGRMEAPCGGKLLPVAKPEEVRLGPAEILSNVEGDKVEAYTVEVVRVYHHGETQRSMMLKVTDPDLLSRTGGIVQGMSGSPILQDGKLVGAVTHVLVNDPTRGYGIFIENMLEAAG